VPYAQDVTVPLTAHLVLLRLWSIVQQERRAHPTVAQLTEKLPLHLLKAKKQPDAWRPQKLWDFTSERNWDWPTDSWLKQLHDLGAEPKVISLLVKCV